MKHRFTFVLSLVVALACRAALNGSDRVTGQQKDAQPEGMSATAYEYLATALDIVERNSVNRREVQWSTLRAQAIQKVANAQQPAETYDAIRFVIASLPDRRGGFADPQLMKRDERTIACSRITAVAMK